MDANDDRPTLSSMAALPLTHPRWTADVGVPIEFYRGEIEIETTDGWESGLGVVWLGWFPKPRLFVHASLKYPTTIDLEADLRSRRIRMPGLGGGTVLAVGGPDPPGATTVMRPGVTVSGWSDDLLVGVPDSVPTARFLIVNGPKLLGDPIRAADGVWRGSTTLSGGGWDITIQQRRDMLGPFGQRTLQWQPYVFTHIGEIRSADGREFSRSRVTEAMTLLGSFLSFVRGSLSRPIITCGIDDAGAVTWEDWGSVAQTVEVARTPLSWFDTTLTDRLPDIFAGFCDQWDTDRQAVSLAVGLYCGANNPSPVQNGLTLAVTGLEMMAWLQLVQNGRMEAEAFDESGARAGTLRDLVELLGLRTDRVPEELVHLRKSGMLGHTAIWRLRSDFIHPRLKTANPNVGANFGLLTDAWRLATWYLELSLLHWFGYSGPYNQRLQPRWIGDTKPVPWTTDQP